MNKQKVENIVQEDAIIIWKNFSGKPDKFSPQGGKRTFNLVLSADQAEQLVEEGWNVKSREPKDGDGDILYYLPVRVNYGGRPPKIYLVTNKQKTLLDEDTVGSLDYAEIEKVDLVISPYPWDMGGKSGITAYVKTMYVTIAQDEFADKYGDYDDDADEIAFD